MCVWQRKQSVSLTSSLDCTDSPLPMPGADDEAVSLAIVSTASTDMGTVDSPRNDSVTVSDVPVHAAHVHTMVCDSATCPRVSGSSPVGQDLLGDM